MASDLVRARPDAFSITAAHQDAATRVCDLGSGATLWLSEGLSNSWLIVTRAGRVVINTGMGFESSVHRALYDAVDDRPISHVILTQGHVDHLGGVDLFVEDGTEIVAQESNAACQADDARIHAFRVRRSMPFWADAVAAADAHIRAHAGSEVPGQSKPTPTITFGDRLDLDVGGLAIELLSTPGGETVDSLCVWLPESRVAVVGNLFSALFGHVPNLMTVRGDRYRFVEPFLESLDRVRALRPARLCTGHFAPIEGEEVIADELDRIEAAVGHLHDATLEGMNAGVDLFTLMSTVRLPDEISLGEGYGKLDWAVRAIWESYAGWFHARSTTELYPVPPSAAYPEMVDLAGGVAAVAARAVSMADDGEPVLAIHLAEMALAAEPDAPDALAAQLHAHSVLLAAVEGRNFWETGWLRTVIGGLERQLEDRT